MSRRRNQKLREELFKYFLQSGHPETALEVADEGLKIDPYNADLYDLKSNACLFLSNFKCAVDALETMYATDSTKADTLFFTKICGRRGRGRAAGYGAPAQVVADRRARNTRTIRRCSAT